MIKMTIEVKLKTKYLHLSTDILLDLLFLPSHLVDYHLHGFTKAGGVLFANTVSWINEE